MGKYPNKGMNTLAEEKPEVAKKIMGYNEGGIVAAASAIANVTPSMRDNEILAKLDDFVQKLALNLKK